MSKRNIAVAVMFSLAALLPGTLLVLTVFGWQLVIQKPILCIAVGTVVFAALFVVVICQKAPFSKTASVLLVLQPMLTAVNVLLCMFYTDNLPATVLAGAWVVLSVILLFYLEKYMVAKIISVVLTGLLVVVFAQVALIYFTLGQMGSSTVTDTVYSPSRTYRAEVVSLSQGATGGDTLVRVYKDKACLQLWLFRLEKKPQTVYRGEWGEHEYMQLRWESEQTLTIHDQAYAVE